MGLFAWLVNKLYNWLLPDEELWEQFDEEGDVR